MNITEYVKLILDTTPESIKSIQFEIKTTAKKTKDGLVVNVADPNSVYTTGVIRFKLDRRPKDTLFTESEIRKSIKGWYDPENLEDFMANGLKHSK